MTETNDALRRQRRLSSLLRALKARGLRMTPQRLAILRALVMHPGHPTAEELYRTLLPEFPLMSLATVYKTLVMLKEEGQALELEFSGRENHFDGFNPNPHPHLICTRCGRIQDPEVSGLGRIIEALAQATGYELVSHRLDFYGLCPECRDK